MTNQTVTPDALIAATEAIIHARGNVAHYEIRQAKLAHYYNRDDDALTLAHRALAARGDAGSNDAARRAYADRETAAERESLANIAAELLNVEATLINMKCELAQAIDRRRLLETLIRLMAVTPSGDDTDLAALDAALELEAA